MPDEFRRCWDCKETKLLSTFRKDKSRKDGYSHLCGTCNVKRAKKWYEDNPQRHADWKRQHQYGLSPDQYAKLRENQANHCAICSCPFTETPHVDHCHQTGAVRELLCMGCNKGLGFFEDDPERMEQAAAYVRRHRPKAVAVVA